MKRFAATRPTRLGVGLVLALLLGHCASPTTADAGCGDHLLAFRTDGAADAPLPASPAPCRGPDCSRDERPPLAPASVKVNLPEPKARPSEPPDAPAAARSGWLPGDEFPCPARTPDPIFHPPR